MKNQWSARLHEELARKESEVRFPEANESETKGAHDKTTEPAKNALSEVFNIAYGQRTTLNQLAQILKDNLSNFDPAIANIKTNAGNRFCSVELNVENLAEADCVVLTTDHSAFDMEFVQKHAKMIVDIKNMIEKASETVYKF